MQFSEKQVVGLFSSQSTFECTHLYLKTKPCLNQEQQSFDVPFKDVSVTYYFKQVLEQSEQTNHQKQFHTAL